MAIRSHSLVLQETNSENIQSNTSTIKSKQILSDSTNIHLKNSQISSVGDNDPIRANHLDYSKIPIYIESSINSQNSQEEEYHSLNQDEQFQIQQRAIYNARQTPFIPFIIDMDFPMIVDSSQQQDDLLMNILSLVHNINEECSFYEQFKI